MKNKKRMKTTTTTKYYWNNDGRGAFSQSTNRIDFDTYFRMKCTFIWVNKLKQAWLPGMTSGLV